MGSRQAARGTAGVPVIPAVCPALWHEHSFFSMHTQAAQQSPNTADADLKTMMELESIGQFSQGQVRLLGKPLLDLFACLGINQQVTTGTFAPGLESPGLPVLPK